MAKNSNEFFGLKAAAIPVEYFEIPDTGHDKLPLEKFKEALNFVME